MMPSTIHIGRVADGLASENTNRLMIGLHSRGLLHIPYSINDHDTLAGCVDKAVLRTRSVHSPALCNNNLALRSAKDTVWEVVPTARLSCAPIDRAQLRAENRSADPSSQDL